MRGRLNHPATPDRECSKRAWTGRLNAWRRSLHMWDNEGAIAEAEKAADGERRGGRGKGGVE